MAHRRLMFFAALVAVLAGSIVAWTAAGAGFQIMISPLTGEGGEPVKLVTSLTKFGGTFSIIQGAAQKISGVELYEIKLGSSDLCDEVKINLVFQNPYDMGKVLNNPKAFLDVGVWYPVETGSDDSVVLDRTGQWLDKDEGPKAHAMMSEAQGSVILEPSKTVTSTLHILASIVVPKAPPGQQQKQSLKFWSQVRK